jgi:hypothetical protein
VNMVYKIMRAISYLIFLTTNLKGTYVYFRIRYDYLDLVDSLLCKNWEAKHSLASLIGLFSIV